MCCYQFNKIRLLSVSGEGTLKLFTALLLIPHTKLNTKLYNSRTNTDNSLRGIRKRILWITVS